MAESDEFHNWPVRPDCGLLFALYDWSELLRRHRSEELQCCNGLHAFPEALINELSATSTGVSSCDCILAMPQLVHALRASTDSEAQAIMIGVSSCYGVVATSCSAAPAARHSRKPRSLNC